MKASVFSFRDLTLGVCATLTGLAFCSASWAQIGVHATLDEVLEQSFPASSFVDGPSNKTLWLQKDLKARFQDDLGFDLPGLRVRYWQSNDRTLWILEEIGKEYPITFAYTIAGESPEKNGVVSARVMEYREVRGGEIRHDFFRSQYVGAALSGDKLNTNIDGITGATLSVRAMTKMAKTALWLHNEVIYTELAER